MSHLLRHNLTSGNKMACHAADDAAMKLSTLNQKICRTTALLATLLATAGSAHAAEGLKLYGTLGPSDADYSNSGIGLKLGADFASGFLGPRELGLTAFYAYTNAHNDYAYSGCSRWSVSNHSLALGPTLTLAIPQTRLSFQARGYGSVNLWNVSAGCSTWNSSGSDFDIGYGVGLHYQLTPSLALRADWDSIGWRSSLLSFGVTLRY